MVRERLTGPKEATKGGLADLAIHAWFLTGTREEQWSRPGMLLRDLDSLRAQLDLDEGPGNSSSVVSERSCCLMFFLVRSSLSLRATRES